MKAEWGISHLLCFLNGSVSVSAVILWLSTLNINLLFSWFSLLDSGCLPRAHVMRAGVGLMAGEGRHVSNFVASEVLFVFCLPIC